MNKKKYIAPKYKCIKTVGNSSILNTSDVDVATVSFFGGDGGGVNGVTPEAEVKAHNMWDDEW